MYSSFYYDLSILLHSMYPVASRVGGKGGRPSRVTQSQGVTTDNKRKKLLNVVGKMVKQIVGKIIV